MKKKEFKVSTCSNWVAPSTSWADLIACSGDWSTWSGCPVGGCHVQWSSQGLLHSTQSLHFLFGGEMSVFLSKTAKAVWAPYPRLTPFSASVSAITTKHIIKNKIPWSKISSWLCLIWTVNNIFVKLCRGKCKHRLFRSACRNCLIWFNWKYPLTGIKNVEHRQSFHWWTKIVS